MNRAFQKTTTTAIALANRICGVMWCDEKFVIFGNITHTHTHNKHTHIYIYKCHDNEMFTCKWSPTKCVCGPSLCCCARDCSAFTVKIIAVSKRITPMAHIWPELPPLLYRWQFDDCNFCKFLVVHTLRFLMNNIVFVLCLVWLVEEEKQKTAVVVALFSYVCRNINWYATVDYVQRHRSSKFDAATTIIIAQIKTLTSTITTKI